MTPEPRVLHTIRVILAAVCIADIGLGLLILFVPGWLFMVFRVPQPQELLWFQLIGLMLIPTAIDGLVGFRDPDHYRRNIQVSAGSRLASAAFLLLVNSVRVVPTILLVLAIGEALVGLLTVHYLVSSSPRRSGGHPSLAARS